MLFSLIFSFGAKRRFFGISVVCTVFDIIFAYKKVFYPTFFFFIYKFQKPNAKSRTTSPLRPNPTEHP
jgi:hypothetical protein